MYVAISSASAAHASLAFSRTFSSTVAPRMRSSGAFHSARVWAAMSSMNATPAANGSPAVRKRALPRLDAVGVRLRLAQVLLEPAAVGALGVIAIWDRSTCVRPTSSACASFRYCTIFCSD